MRLQKRLIETIKTSIDESFGEVDVYLFGSRVDDTKKGGDIDLAIDIDIPRGLFREKKVAFFASLMRKGFEHKIDVVPYHTHDALLWQQIQDNHIKL